MSDQEIVVTAITDKGYAAASWVGHLKASWPAIYGPLEARARAIEKRWGCVGLHEGFARWFDAGHDPRRMDEFALEGNPPPSEGDQELWRQRIAEWDQADERAELRRCRSAVAASNGTLVMCTNCGRSTTEAGATNCWRCR